MTTDDVDICNSSTITTTTATSTTTTAASLLTELSDIHQQLHLLYSAAHLDCPTAIPLYFPQRHDRQQLTRLIKRLDVIQENNSYGNNALFRMSTESQLGQETIAAAAATTEAQGVLRRVYQQSRQLQQRITQLAEASIQYENSRQQYFDHDSPVSSVVASAATPAAAKGFTIVGGGSVAVSTPPTVYNSLSRNNSSVNKNSKNNSISESINDNSSIEAELLMQNMKSKLKIIEIGVRSLSDPQTSFPSH